MNKLDVLVELRAELDTLIRERDEKEEAWERRKELLVEIEFILRRVMEYPEAWEIAPAVARLLVRIREEVGLDAAGAV